MCQVIAASIFGWSSSESYKAKAPRKKKARSEYRKKEAPTKKKAPREYKYKGKAGPE